MQERKGSVTMFPKRWERLKGYQESSVMVRLRSNINRDNLGK